MSWKVGFLESDGHFPSHLPEHFGNVGDGAWVWQRNIAFSDPIASNRLRHRFLRWISDKKRLFSRESEIFSTLFFCENRVIFFGIRWLLWPPGRFVASAVAVQVPKCRFDSLELVIRLEISFFYEYYKTIIPIEFAISLFFAFSSG